MNEIFDKKPIFHSRFRTSRFRMALSVSVIWAVIYISYLYFGNNFYSKVYQSIYEQECGNYPTEESDYAFDSAPTKKQHCEASAILGHSDWELFKKSNPLITFKEITIFPFVFLLITAFWPEILKILKTTAYKYKNWLKGEPTE